MRGKKSNLIALVIFFWTAFFFASPEVIGQTLTANGNSIDLGQGCYQMTDGVAGSNVSSIWYNNRIALNNPFDFTFYVYHQARPIGNTGGDGLAFVVQRDPSGTAAIGEQGYAQGFSGFTGGGGNPISPSFAVELDIWDNTPTLANEIAADHISMFFNGNIDAVLSPPPVSALPAGANVTVGECRAFRIKWIPSVDSIYVWYVNSLRMARQLDIRTPFGVNDTVWFGITAASGGAPIQQIVCFQVPQINTNDTTVCSGANVTLNPGGGTTFTWTPSGSLSCNYCASPVFLAPVAGNYDFALSDTSAQGCPIRDTLHVTVEQTPNANAGPNVGICPGDSVQIGTPDAPGFTYSWFPTSGMNNSTLAQPNVSPGSTTNYGVTVVDTTGTASCSALDIVQVTVVALSSTTNAGIDTTICDTSYTMMGNVPGVSETGTWSLLSGTGNISNPNSGGTLVSGLASGANVFEWSVTNGSCTQTDTVMIMVNGPVIANAGADTSLCVDQYVLAANVPNANESGTWTSLTPGPNFVSPSSPNSMVTNLSPGADTLIWTVSNTFCSNQDTIIIFYTSSTGVNAGNDTLICGSAFQLNGNPPAGGASGSWTSSDAGVVITNPNAGNSPVTNLQVGVTSFYWTISNGICSFTDTMNVNSAAPVTSVAGPDTTICTDTITLYTDPPLVGTGKWDNLLGGAAVFSDSNSPTAFVSNLQPGINSLLWTVENLPCSETDTLLIFVTIPGQAFAGNDSSICDTSIQLYASGNFTGTGNWSGTGGVNFTNPSDSDAIAFNLNNGANDFIWTVTSGNCSVSDTVTITAYVPPVAASAGPDQIIQGNPSTNMAAVLPVTGQPTWFVLTPGPTVQTLSDPNTAVNGLLPGNNVFAWVIRNGPCPVASDTVVILFIEAGEIPTGFSPNGDGVNDFFEIPGTGFSGPVQIEIFNRWGNLVYSSDDYQNNWSGTNGNGDPLADDTYFVVATLSDGSTYKGYLIIKR